MNSHAIPMILFFNFIIYIFHLFSVFEMTCFMLYGCKKVIRSMVFCSTLYSIVFVCVWTVGVC